MSLAEVDYPLSIVIHGDGDLVRGFRFAATSLLATKRSTRYRACRSLLCSDSRMRDIDTAEAGRGSRWPFRIKSGDRGLQGSEAYDAYHSGVGEEQSHQRP